MTTHSQRRQYHEALAAYMRIEERISHLQAEKEIALARLTRCACSSDKEMDRYEPRAAWHEKNAATHLVLAQAPRDLAEKAEVAAESAKNEEIKQDYYSGPPGSFTGD